MKKFIKNIYKGLFYIFFRIMFLHYSIYIVFMLTISPLILIYGGFVGVREWYSEVFNYEHFKQQKKWVEVNLKEMQ